MGREVRRVPANYQHPKDEYGHYKGLCDNFNKDTARWDKEAEMWNKGFRWNYDKEYFVPNAIGLTESYEEYAGDRPKQEEYMPDWPEVERTHFMMFETCTEGSPISPAFNTPEELARWLADNKASVFGSETATYEQWFFVCKGGYAPSAIIENGVIRSGVAVIGESGYADSF